MRLLRLLLLASVQSLALSPSASNSSLSRVLPSDANITSNKRITSNRTLSPNNDFDVECRPADHVLPYRMDVRSCGPAIAIICRIIRVVAVSREGEGFWTWVPLTAGWNCAAAFYIPIRAPESTFPSLAECHETFERIALSCGYLRYANVGTVNVNHLPRSSWPGTAIDETSPRYLMAPRRL